MKTTTVLGTALLAAVVPFTLAACSDGSATADKNTASSAKAADDASTPATESSAPATTAGAAPAWAEGSTNVGKKIGSFTTNSWKIDLYQVGTAKTDSDSMLADPDTKKTLLPKGSTVVFVNYVLTNTSKAPISLGSSLADPELKAADWKYMSGQPGSSSDEQYEALKLSQDGHKTGTDKPYVVAPGQTFAEATSIKYVPGQKAEADVSLTPVDASGNLVFDKAEKGKTTVTIK